MGRWGELSLLGVFKLIPVNFPGLVASSHAKGSVLILAVRIMLLILLHQIKECYRVSICKKKKTLPVLMVTFFATNWGFCSILNTYIVFMNLDKYF